MLRFNKDYGLNDWRLPVPETWKRDYQDRKHVKEANEAVEQYREGCLALDELIMKLHHAYCTGYAAGLETPHYPVPAIANPLYVIAAMPCGTVTDFIDIGYYGRYWK